MMAFVLFALRKRQKSTHSSFRCIPQPEQSSNSKPLPNQTTITISYIEYEKKDRTEGNADVKKNTLSVWKIIKILRNLLQIFPFEKGPLMSTTHVGKSNVWSNWTTNTTTTTFSAFS